MARIFVTVGMGPWPFDRLVRALTPLCADHEVFAQTGTSVIRPPCPHRGFLVFDEFQARIQHADLVICHAGNTVRVVQRLGKVPVAVARQAAFGEMGNDHQVHYLRKEAASGPVLALWDLRDLSRLVAAHPAEQTRLLRERSVPAAASATDIIAVLDSLSARLCGDGHG
jgi:UDP-N-acetylglucosamine transferase subunit ALG13